MGFAPTTLRGLVGCSNHWATGDSMGSNCQIVGMQWNRIARLHSHVLGSYELTNSIAPHIKASHMNSVTASRCHIKAFQDASNQPPKWVYYWETTTTWYYINSSRNVDSESELQMGFEPTTLRDLVWWASQIVGVDWNLIAFKSHMELGFFWVYVSPRIYVISCCCWFIKQSKIGCY